MDKKKQVMSNIEYIARLVRRGMVHVDVFNSVVDSEIKNPPSDMEEAITMDEIRGIKEEFGIYG